MPIAGRQYISVKAKIRRSSVLYHNVLNASGTLMAQPPYQPVLGLINEPYQRTLTAISQIGCQ